MPDLTDIITAIKNTDITLSDGTAVTAYDMDAVPNRIISDHLPARLMLPPGADGKPAMESFEYVSYGQATAVWRVVDLMLYRPVAQGGGLKNIWSQLTDYIVQYTATLASRDNRHLTTRAMVAGFKPQANVLEWPRGSGNKYHGVQIAVLVQENIC